MTNKSGFTLVELLVVVAIIGVLSTIGITVFTGARQSAQQAKIKADIDAIKKAYEANYDPVNDTYRPLQSSDFSNGEIPVQPGGLAYPGLITVQTPGYTIASKLDGYIVCGTLQDNNNYCSTSSQGAAAQYYSSIPATVAGFTDRIKLNIANSGVALADYQIPITLNTSTLIGASTPKMQSDCRDIVVVGENNTILPHWIEEGSFPCNTSTTKIWTKVPSIPNGSSNIYLYHNNPSASNTASGDSVFLSFDDFSASSINTAKWTILAGNGIISQGSGQLNFSYTGSQNNDWWTSGRPEKALKLNTLPSGNFHAQVKLWNYTVNTSTHAGIGVYGTDLSTYFWGRYNNNYQLEKVGVSNLVSSAITTLPMHLAIRKIGTQYSFYLSTDSNTWTKVGGDYSDIPFNNIVLFGKEWGGSDLAFNMRSFFIRKFASSEPSVATAP